MTAEIPFKNWSNMAVINKVVRGERPKRPSDDASPGFSVSLWQIAEDSWRQSPEERSTARVLLDQLNQITRHWVPPSSVEVALYSAVEEDTDQSLAFSDIG